MAPLRIGLTGGIAVGKSEALAAFARLGAATISSDAIVHELLDAEPMLSAVADRWGAEIVAGGTVDRSRVGEIVFAEPDELAWLEARIHPLVGERITSWLGALPARLKGLLTRLRGLCARLGALRARQKALRARFRGLPARL